MQDLIEAWLRRGRSALIQHAGRRLFFDVQVPAVWLFAIGYRANAVASLAGSARRSRVKWPAGREVIQSK
jgi:hypothetical protein